MTKNNIALKNSHENLVQLTMNLSFNLILRSWKLSWKLFPSKCSPLNAQPKKKTEERKVKEGVRKEKVKTAVSLLNPKTILIKLPRKFCFLLKPRLWKLIFYIWISLQPVNGFLISFSSLEHPENCSTNIILFFCNIPWDKWVLGKVPSFLRKLTFQHNTTFIHSFKKRVIWQPKSGHNMPNQTPDFWLTQISCSGSLTIYSGSVFVAWSALLRCHCWLADKAEGKFKMHP